MERSPFPKVKVAGVIDIGEPMSAEIRADVLREGARLQRLVEQAALLGQRPCCVRISDTWELREDDATALIVGSCAQFVDHCYTVAGRPLVASESLPDSGFTPGEDEDTARAYRRAGGTIRRLYPSYLIRAFQVDAYPWQADLTYAFYPDNF